MQLEKENLETKSTNSLVALLDILGYKNLLEESLDNIHVTFEVILKDIENKNQNNTEFYSGIEIKIFSDSIIVTLDLEHIEDKALTTARFLYFLSSFTCFFISETKYFLRGGVAIGGYAQKRLVNNENFLIYSEALNIASELEKQADVPRILLSSEIVRLLKSKDLNNSMVIEGSDKLNFLDIYSLFSKDDKNIHLANTFNEFKEAIVLQARKNINNRRVLNKLYWFQEYHNKKLWDLKTSSVLNNIDNLLVRIPYNI